MRHVRSILHRLLRDERRAAEPVHFHHRGSTPEPCHDPACRLPRLEV